MSAEEYIKLAREGTKLRANQAVEALDSLTGDDPEGDHSSADAILLGVVPASVEQAYGRLMGRAGWWATA